MRSFTKILASSVYFDSVTPAISTSAAASTAQFSIVAGATAGPLGTQQGCGVAMQGLFGGAGATTGFGGTFSILGSNVLEKPMFQIVATTTVSSSGSWLLRDSSPWYRFVDFQFVPKTAQGSSGFLTVVYHQKGNF